MVNAKTFNAMTVRDLTNSAILTLVLPATIFAVRNAGPLTCVNLAKNNFVEDCMARLPVPVSWH